MTTCAPLGWGTCPWGIAPWGGVPESPSAALPAQAPFDIYCFSDCASIGTLLTRLEVECIEPGQLGLDPATGDVLLQSGASAASETAQIVVHARVPTVFTLEWTARFDSLPPNFRSLGTNHVFFGCFDAQGPVAGLFVSRVGIAYAGAVHLSNGQLVLDGPFQVLPDSQQIVAEHEQYTFRLGVDSTTGAVYVYVTKTSDVPRTGHHLRFVLPTICASTALLVPADQTLLSVAGTADYPSGVRLAELCLGSGFLVPAARPVADAGVDQAASLCSIVELDASRSYDGQGAPLTYFWRMIDAPEKSQYASAGFDACTYPFSPSTGYTDRLYSGSLGNVHAGDAILSGDVLFVDGAARTILGAGSDPAGFFVRVSGYVLSDALSNAPYKLIRQRAVSTATNVKATAFPDVAGLYRFDLTVFNGTLLSSSTAIVVNVTEAPVARGCLPDLHFIWDYLSDFWKLVEDKDRIELFWQGLAQVAASELLTLWQIDYSKSLRDIQRTFQRRWLHYDLEMLESAPDLVEVRRVYGPLDIGPIASEGVDVGGSHLDLALLGRASPLVIKFPRLGRLSAEQMRGIVAAALAQVLPDVSSHVIVSRDGSEHLVRVTASASMGVASTTTLPVPILASPSVLRWSGQAVGPRIYKATRTLQHLDWGSEDVVLLTQGAGYAEEALGYRIGRVVDDPSDPWPCQRLTLLDEISLPGPSTFSVPDRITSSTLDCFGGLACMGDLARFNLIDVQTGALSTCVLPVLGVCPVWRNGLLLDLAPLEALLATGRATQEFAGLLRATRIPLDPLVVDLPLLQEKIRPAHESEVLRRNIDFFLETFRGQPCLRFVSQGVSNVWDGGAPPSRLWAEVTLLDNRPTIEANFGLLAGFTLDDLAELPATVDYLSAVRGLWYAYFNGPTLYNLRAGGQILLGLPFAEEPGTIVEIREDFSPNQGRILVRDSASTEIVRSYTYPSGLGMDTNPTTGLAYQVGDSVERFSPLVRGVELLDWVKDPRWFARYLGQGFFKEVEKYAKFLFRVDSRAFNLAALGFVQSFIRRVKPTYTMPLFVVLAHVSPTEIDVSDTVFSTARLLLQAGGSFFETFGAATMLDQPRPAGGGWRSQLDRDSDPGTDAPIAPSAQLVRWGIDKNYLCPEDVVHGAIRTSLPRLNDQGETTALPQLDSVFRLDLPVEDLDGSPQALLFEANHVAGVPAAPLGFELLSNAPLPQASGTFSYLQLEILGASDVGASTSFQLVLSVGEVEHVLPPFVAAGSTTILYPINLDVTAADAVRVRIRPTAPGVGRPFWHHVFVHLFQGASWALDTVFSAGHWGMHRYM